MSSATEQIIAVKFREPAGPGGHRAGLPEGSVTTHGPVMPIWSCAGCDAPWPCPTRKRELRAEYAGAPVSLALYLGSCLVQATQDLPYTLAGALHSRFLGWTRAERRAGRREQGPDHEVRALFAWVS